MTVASVEAVLIQQLMDVKTRENQVLHLVTKLRSGASCDARMVGIELKNLVNQLEALESFLDEKQAA